MGVMTPDMLDRNGAVLESTPLGDIRSLPLYGTGDQANGYPYTKWCAEKMVFEAGRRGIPVFVHRAGLIGGHSETGVLAEDVFFHFLSDVVKLRELPDMEGAKFNITPVDWVAKAIVQVATAPSYARYASGAIHPAASGNTVTMLELAQVLSRAGYDGLRWVDFVEWRRRMAADPEQFKSWSFCASLTVEGNGIDSMADNEVGFRAMSEAVGAEVDNFEPRVGLERMLRFCQQTGLLPAPDAAHQATSDEVALTTFPSPASRFGEASRPLLDSSGSVRPSTEPGCGV